MIVTCVHIKVFPASIEDFIIASRENHFESVKEPGNLRFDFTQKSDDPCSFMLYEAYESEEAAAAHKNTGHYAKWRDKVKDYMSEPRQGVEYKIIEPTDKKKW